MSEHPVVIVGAGFAGLVAAQRLRENNIPVIIFEASASAAGLAATFTDMEGFKYDFGTHLITNRLAETLGIEALCRDVEYFGESIVLNGKTYSYPFGLSTVPRYCIDAIKSRLAGIGKSITSYKDAASWAESTVGYAMAHDVAIPLMEGLAGAKATELSPEIGNKLPGVLHTLYLRAMGRINKKAVAIGYCQDLPETPSVWHAYPQGGIAAICKNIIEKLDCDIRLKTPVKKIVIEKGRAIGVETEEGFQSASAVISTAPVNILPRLAPDAQVLKPMLDFRYSNIVFVNLFLMGRKLLPDVAVWFPEDKYDFFRVQEPPISLPWTAPEGKTYFSVDIGCDADSELWNMEDEALADRALEQLSEVVPNIRERHIDHRVLRTRIAYPVYRLAYEETRQKFKNSSGVPGLYSVGRNGEFAHILMEDVYHRTRARINTVIEDLQKV